MPVRDPLPADLHAVLSGSLRGGVPLPEETVWAWMGHYWTMLTTSALACAAPMPACRWVGCVQGLAMDVTQAVQGGVTGLSRTQGHALSVSVARHLWAHTVTPAMDGDASGGEALLMAAVNTAWGRESLRI